MFCRDRQVHDRCLRAGAMAMGAELNREMAQVLGLFRIEHYKPEASA